MKIRKSLYRLLILFFLVMLLISGAHIVRYVIDTIGQKNEYDALAAQVEASRVEPLPQPAVSATIPSQEAPSATDIDAEPVILPEYASLYEENQDFIGWMRIDGTSVNYPVMQTPDQIDFYLDHNFKKEPNSHGCLYVRESCDVFAPSDNMTIYGHHMRNGTMFASLDKFQQKEFWQQYQTINFDTLYEHHTYTVFAVFRTTATLGEGFDYHLFEDAADEAEFNDFVSACKSLALYDTGITPEYGDKMICLSTCEYSQTNGRLVVAAVRNEP